MSYRKSYDIAAYTFNAEILCPGCVSDAIDPTAFVPTEELQGLSVEHRLDRVALQRCIDRQDESSYDSDEFPKVVFVDAVQDHEICDACGGELL